MEVLKEYYKQKGDTLTMIQSENKTLRSHLNSTKSELNITIQKLQTTEEALQLAEEKYDNLNRNYAQLEANRQKLSATKQAESNALKGQIQQLRSQNESMKSIVSRLDDAYQIHLNGAVVQDDDWNEKLSRMQEISEVMDADRSQLAGLFQILSENAIFREDGFEVLHISEAVVIRLRSDPIFREGKTQLNTKGRNIVAEITGVIVRNSNLDVVVEGHTDNLGSDNTNWNISALRASAIVKQMIKSDLRPSRVQAIGRSSHKRIAYDDTEAARKPNRRVEIIIRPRTYR